MSDGLSASLIGGKLIRQQIMRNINKLISEWKSNNQQHRQSNRRLTKTSSGRLDAMTYQVWGKIQEVNIRFGELLGQVFSRKPVKAIKLQPVRNRKTRKPTILLALFAVMLTTLFTNCNNTVPTAKKTRPSDTLALQGQVQQLDTIRSNEDYLAIIDDYKMNEVENLSAYNQESFMFQTVMMPVMQTDNQQTLDTLKHQHKMLKMRIDSFQDKGEESWEAFKMELNQDIDAMKKTLNDSTAISKTVIN